MLTTSIALTTYNGMKNIKELLDSIKNQTETADEIVIFDDCSTDGTDLFVEEYINNYQLKHWCLYRNDNNVGWKLNFRNAFNRCSSDLIFPCDQDDIWYKNKVKDMKAVMETDKNILLLLSNYNVINENRKDIIRVKGLRKNDGSVVRKPFSFSSLIEMRPGCVTCFRKKIKDLIHEKDDISFPHDTIVWGYAAIHDGVALLNRITMSYRRHLQSATAKKELLNYEKKLDDLELERKVLCFFIDRCCIYGEEEKARILLAQKSFYNTRINLIKERKIIRLLFFSIINVNHYATKRNMISDFFTVIKG